MFANTYYKEIVFSLAIYLLFVFVVLPTNTLAAMVGDGSLNSTTEINSSTTNGPTLSDGDNYGRSVANLGDLNGDGVNDIAVGAYGDDTGGTDRGAIHISFMNTDGSIKSTVEINDATTNGPALNDSDRYGTSVAGIGDLNNDGVIDIAVGADQADTGGSGKGALYIHFMNADGSVESTVEINDNTANGPVLTNNDFYGASVAGLGDLNGDGVEDLVVGAYQDDAGGTDIGAVHISFMNVDGSIDSTVEINDTTTNGPTLTAFDSYGTSVSNLGDLNADGVTDILVGASGDDAGGTNRGAVHIHYMNTDGSVDATVELNDVTTNGPVLAGSDNYGLSVGSLGDLDKDGVLDLLVGAKKGVLPFSNRGVVYIHFMNRDGSIRSTAFIDTNTTNGPTLAASDDYAISVSTIGDLNNDDVTDLAIGAYGDDTGGSARGAVYIHFMYGLFVPDPAPQPGYSAHTSDLRKEESKIIVRDNFQGMIITQPFTFAFDTNLGITNFKKVPGVRIPSAYWQIGDTYEIWFTSSHNGARVYPDLYTGKIPITVLRYTNLDLYSPGTDSYFPESNVRVAYSMDNKVWKTLPNTVANPALNEVAFIHHLNGYFALVARY